MEWIAVLAIGLVAGTLGGIVGFGTSIMLLPILVIAFGPLEAVPMMAVTALMANFSRVVVWWREVDWKVWPFMPPPAFRLPHWAPQRCSISVPGASKWRWPHSSY